MISLDGVSSKLSFASTLVDFVGYAIVFIFVSIFVVLAIRSMFFVMAHEYHKASENLTRYNYKRHNKKFDVNHPDHFAYERKFMGVTYYPNHSKGRKYYAKKRKQYSYKYPPKRNYRRNYKRKRF